MGVAITLIIIMVVAIRRRRRVLGQAVARERIASSSGGPPAGFLESGMIREMPSVFVRSYYYSSLKLL